MSCYHPMYKFKAGKNPDGTDHLVWITNPTLSTKDLHRIYGKDLVQIPCGKCLGCQLDYSKQWATRCVLESALYEKNCFVTLTFDEQHCPDRVSKSDLSSFLKRLRNKFPSCGVRFFGCGEYGSKNDRPHYHVILFNFDFPDKKPLSDKLWTSEILKSLWPYGISSIGNVTFASCGYVARYCMKKRSGESKFKDEFVLMSRRPGIGAQYYYDNKNLIFLSDYVYGHFSDYKYKAPIPRFYRKLAEKDGVVLDEFVDRRIMSANSRTNLDMHLYNCDAIESLNKYSLSRLIAKSEFLRRNL